MQTGRNLTKFRHNTLPLASCSLLGLLYDPHKKDVTVLRNAGNQTTCRHIHEHSTLLGFLISVK
jgi:hypothetical protein